MATKENRKNPKGSDGSISRLSDFSRALDEMAERKRKEDIRIAKKAKAELPEWTAQLKDMTSDQLFESYDSALSGGYSNHHLMRVLVVWKGRIKKEMIRRMEG